MAPTTISLQVVPVERRFVGCTTAELELAPGEGLFGVVRDDGSFVLKEAKAEILLEPGDSLVCSRKID